MKTTKVSEAIGAQLDWAVSAAQGDSDIHPYSTDWSDGGPIIEEKEIDIVKICPGTWRATMTGTWFNGTTPLIAAMRCFSASVLGDEVEVPDELVPEPQIKLNVKALWPFR